MSKKKSIPAAQPTISGQDAEVTQTVASETTTTSTEVRVHAAVDRRAMGRTNELCETQRDESKVFDRGKDSTVFEDNFEIFGGFDSGGTVGEREVGSTFRDGTVGLPATKCTGIPSQTPQGSEKKKKQKNKYISPGRSRFLSMEVSYLAVTQCTRLLIVHVVDDDGSYLLLLLLLFC